MKFPGEGSGKGDAFREVNKKRFDENWERVFGKKACELSHEHDATCKGKESERTGR